MIDFLVKRCYNSIRCCDSTKISRELDPLTYKAASFFFCVRFGNIVYKTATVASSTLSAAARYSVSVAWSVLTSSEVSSIVFVEL